MVIVNGFIDNFVVFVAVTVNNNELSITFSIYIIIIRYFLLFQLVIIINSLIDFIIIAITFHIYN